MNSYVVGIHNTLKSHILFLNKYFWNIFVLLPDLLLHRWLVALVNHQWTSTSHHLKKIEHQIRNLFTVYLKID